MIQTREAHINDDTEAHIGSTFGHSWKKMIKTEDLDGLSKTGDCSHTNLSRSCMEF
jgi:hypothetical protein